MCCTKIGHDSLTVFKSVFYYIKPCFFRDPSVYTYMYINFIVINVMLITELFNESPFDYIRVRGVWRVLKSFTFIFSFNVFLVKIRIIHIQKNIFFKYFIYKTTNKLTNSFIPKEAIIVYINAALARLTTTYTNVLNTSHKNLQPYGNNNPSVVKTDPLYFSYVFLRPCVFGDLQQNRALRSGLFATLFLFYLIPNRRK